MDEDRVAVINVATDIKVLNVTFSSGWTTEDLCIKVSPSETSVFARKRKKCISIVQ